MAEKRMFSKTVIDSDAFLDMPTSSQALYFHLSMRADDDGFVNSPRKILRLVGASDDDLKLLIAKRFILIFESGVIVIKHWLIHNTIKNDRYHPTNYQEEFSRLMIAENKAYTEKGNAAMVPEWSQNGSNLEPQYRLEEDRLEEISLEKGRGGFAPPTLEQITDYCKERKNAVDPQRFFDYYSRQGWKLGNGKAMEDWKAAVRTWEKKDAQKARGNTLEVQTDKGKAEMAKYVQRLKERRT